MGYRSDVTIFIYGPADAMAGFIAAQRIRGGDSGLAYSRNIEFKEWERAFAPDNKTKMLGIYFEAIGIKWYDDYSEVIRWNSTMHQAGDYGNGVCCEFVRVGEDYTDTEFAVWGDECLYYLSINREVSLDLA